MIHAHEAHLKTVAHQRQKSQARGVQLANEYRIELLINDAIVSGKHDIAITVAAEHCHELTRYLQDFGFYVQWNGQRSSPTRSMVIGWHPNDTEEWDGP